MIVGVELRTRSGELCWSKMTNVTPERTLALIHRVIVPDNESPKDYAILVTDSRSIFIHQKKTRSSFVLGDEMR